LTNIAERCEDMFKDTTVKGVKKASVNGDRRKVMFGIATLLHPGAKNLLGKMNTNLGNYSDAEVSALKKDALTELQSILDANANNGIISYTTRNDPSKFTGQFQPPPPKGMGSELENMSEYECLDAYLKSPPSGLVEVKDFWIKLCCHPTKPKPNVFTFVKRYFGIPCTSIFPEQIFSTLSDILSDKRTNMDMDLLEASIFWKRNKPIIEKYRFLLEAYKLFVQNTQDLQNK